MTQIVEFRVAMMSTCTKKGQYSTTRPNIPLQGLDSCTLKVGAISGLAVKLEPYIGTISPVIDLHGQQKAIWKSRPLDISQWRQ